MSLCCAIRWNVMFFFSPPQLHIPWSVNSWDKQGTEWSRPARQDLSEARMCWWSLNRDGKSPHKVGQCYMVRAHAGAHRWAAVWWWQLTEQTAIGNTSGAAVRSRAGSSACLTLDCPSALLFQPGTSALLFMHWRFCSQFNLNKNILLLQRKNTQRTFHLPNEPPGCH